MTIAVRGNAKQLRCPEEQLRQAQKMEAIGRLTSGIAHDFNNLVTIMAGYSSILLKQLSDEDPLYEAAAEIKKASERAASLSRQLMAFSRKQTTDTRVLDLNVIVSNIEKMLGRLIGEDIQLYTILDRALGPIQADPCQIEQLIVNLVINARDAMPSGGRLTITTENIAAGKTIGPEGALVLSGPAVKLSVCDTGSGMDGETRARIFEPFFTTKKPDKGTGLGLTMVYEIIRNSGGTIRVDSAPGLGTTIEIYLPQAKQVATPIASDMSPGESPQGSETVLLVEDEETVRSVIRCVLQKHGYTVLEAPHGKAALLLSSRYAGPIHLLLTDVVMPHMSGRDLARCMSPLRPELKVLYMTGYANHSHVSQDILDTHIAFVDKPFTPDDLLRQVRLILDTPQHE